MSTTISTVSSPSIALTSYPSPFLPLSHPHVYGFSLPLIFSFLPSQCFPILLQITNHSTWKNALQDPLTTSHYSYIIEEDHHEDFSFLSPHFTSLIRKIEVEECGIGPYTENAKIFGENGWTYKYVMILKGILEHLKSVFLSISPLSLSLRSLTLSFQFTYHCDSTIAFIQRVLDDIITYQMSIQSQSRCPFSPLLLHLNFYCQCVDVYEIADIDEELRLIPHLNKWAEQCQTHGITLQVEVHHEGKHPVWEFVIMEKYKYRQTQMLRQSDDVLSSSLSPSPLSFPSSPSSPLFPFPFLHLKSIESLIGNRSPTDRSKIIPFSTILPLACPLLSKLYISPNELWSDMEYKEVGQCVHNMRHSLTSLNISPIEINHDPLNFILSLTAMFPYLTDLSYPNITKMFIFISKYPNSIKGFHTAIYDSYRPFIVKFPHLSSLMVSPAEMLWMLPMENYDEKNTLGNNNILSPLFPNVNSLTIYLGYLLPFGDFYVNPYLLSLVPILIQRVLSTTLQYLEFGNVRCHTAGEGEGQGPSKCICEIFCESLSSCHSLKSIVMTMDQKCCNHKDFLPLFPSLSHCHKLNVMDLSFNDSLWSEEGMTRMKQNIHNENHPHLTSLIVSKMSDLKCVEYMGDILFGLPSLLRVNIHLTIGSENGKENDMKTTKMLLDTAWESKLDTDIMEPISANVLRSFAQMSHLRHLTLHCSSKTFLSYWNDPFFSSVCRHNVRIQSINFYLSATISEISQLAQHSSALLDGINSFYSNEKYHSESLVHLREFHVSFKNSCYATCSDCIRMATEMKEGEKPLCPHEGIINLALNKLSQSDSKRKYRGQKLSCVDLNFSPLNRNLLWHLQPPEKSKRDIDED